MKHFFKLVGIGLLIFFIFLAWSKFGMDASFQSTNSRSFQELENGELVQVFFNAKEGVQIGEEALQVEVVNTPESTAQGLSGRSEIGADGMLFVFPEKEMRYFWMKEMQFDLDMIWIGDGEVLEITESVPAPAENTPDNRLKTYPSLFPVDMVLELPAGDVQNYNISIGDTIQLAE